MTSPSPESTAKPDPITDLSEVVVTQDNLQFWKTCRWTNIVLAVLAVVLFAGALVLLYHPSRYSPGLAPVLVIVLAGLIPQFALNNFNWGGRCAITEPLRLTTSHLIAQTQGGTVRLPWSVVQGVALSQRGKYELISISVAPSVERGVDGVMGPAMPRFWKAIRHGGLSYPTLGLSVAPQEFLRLARSFKDTATALGG